MSEAKLLRVRMLVDELSSDEKLALIEYLAKQILPTPVAGTQDLYGIWQDKFPDDFNLDEALDNIRHEWEEEWPQTVKK